jgi:hypothetical protein
MVVIVNKVGVAGADVADQLSFRYFFLASSPASRPHENHGSEHRRSASARRRPDTVCQFFRQHLLVKCNCAGALI